MEPAFGGATDPWPYIASAYSVGIILLLGFGLVIQQQRVKLRSLLAAIRKS